MILSAEQSSVRDDIYRWLKDPHDSIYHLFGYAGTGKTSIIKELVAGLSGTTLYGAFTGKAASVMRDRGCQTATTIHRLIYLPKGKSRLRLIEMHEQMRQLTESKDDTGEMAQRILKLQRQIDEETANHKRPMFTLNLESDVRHANLLVLDECSMINKQMGKDIMSFGKKVLVMGDPAQLPPIMGAGYFDTKKPQTMLTEIHRQARDNPIIDLATRVRNRERLEEGEYGDSVVMDWADLEPEIVANHEQMIVGRNDTRKGANRRIREIRGIGTGGGYLPVHGDKLVCLKNNHDLGLLNGTQWSIDTCREVDNHTMLLEVHDDDRNVVECTAHTAPFAGKEIPHWDHNNKIEEFDYGYAMTCHKAQGSQWPSVVILDQSRMFKADRYKWLYTALTRASERVTVAR